MAFSVWVHEEQADQARLKELARLLANPRNSDGADVAEGLKRAMQSASEQMAKLPDGQGVKYASCNPDGTAQVRLVSPEEFVRGIGKPAPEPESDKQ